MWQVEHLDNQHRLLILLIALAVFVDMTHPAMLILTVQTQTWSGVVAGLTTFPTLIGWAFAAAALSMVPLMFYLAADCCTRHTFKIACFGACVGSFASIGMSYVSRNLDIGWFSFLYFANGTLCLLFAAALAVFLNDQQVKKHEKLAQHNA